jgi:hypothetical protein
MKARGWQKIIAFASQTVQNALCFSQFFPKKQLSLAAFILTITPTKQD